IVGRARPQFMHITRQLLVAFAGLAIGFGTQGARGALCARGAAPVGQNFGSAQPSTGLDTLRRAFLSPPDDSRIMMRWWWFGPAVTDEELERELRVMKEGGIGGVEVQPVYPLLPDDEAAGIKNLPYLSDEFLDALKFAAQ